MFLNKLNLNIAPIYLEHFKLSIHNTLTRRDCSHEPNYTREPKDSNEFMKNDAKHPDYTLSNVINNSKSLNKIQSQDK